MWKCILTFCLFISVCYCQNTYNLSLHKKKPYHDEYYHHLLYGGGLLYYLTFIIVKIKVAFIIGTILTFIVFGGKLFALVKYAELMKYDTVKHHEPEKIYIQAPSHDHGPSIPYSASSPMHSPSFPSYSHGFSVDQPPPNAEIAGGGQFYDSPPSHQGYGYGRSNSQGILWKIWDLLWKMMRKTNSTERAFNEMKLESVECRKKFVCQMDLSAAFSKLLSKGLQFLRDDVYDSYRINKKISTIEECKKLYPNCQNSSL